jgi:hypothetical protein
VNKERRRKYYALIFILLCSVSISASTLIFKAQKIVDTDTVTILGTFDASKYKSIRIAVTAEDRTERPLARGFARLHAAEGEVRRVDTRVQNGTASPLDYNHAKAELEAAEKMAREETDALYPPIAVYGIDGKDEILIEGRSFLPGGNSSFVIEDPPQNITIKVYGKGKYKLYVWGQ